MQAVVSTGRRLGCMRVPVRSVAVSRTLQTVKDFACPGDQDDTFALASLPLVDVNTVRIQIADVRAEAAFLRDAGCERDVNARRFGCCARVKGTEPLEMCRVRQHASGIVLEPVPLVEEIVAAMVADFVDVFAVGVADL